MTATILDKEIVDAGGKAWFKCAREHKEILYRQKSCPLCLAQIEIEWHNREHERVGLTPVHIASGAVITEVV